MRVFVAGATGVVGSRLVPLLVARGHVVVGTTRSSGNVDRLRAHGAEPVVLDALDRQAVVDAVRTARPDVVVHELTDLSRVSNPRSFARAFAATNLLRTAATDHLLAAARAAGARRFVAQSFAGWPYARSGGAVKTEDDPLDPNPPAAMRASLDAIRHLEAAVCHAGGVALRYGNLYGPGTSTGAGGVLVAQLRRGRFPLVGGGTGIWSFLHADDAATATVAAVESGASGIYNVVDDDPAPVRDWLPALADAVGARPPQRVPVWLARLAVGEAGIVLMTSARGASNAKAKRDLGWAPAHPSWRQGFVTGLGG
jgi:nucleoside-diphosphate-sugar epimerase